MRDNFAMSSLDDERNRGTDYGCVGDMEHTAWNPIWDTVFGGWQEGYEVEVTYTKLSDGTIRISDAWINQ